ncbi:MAG: 1-acyl-sn-glycerol-3-phosphate acyltransferase [bacterium]|nr:1-acyl-sn-glycerol-3-phosphate acyltransferase [bacterium]
MQPFIAPGFNLPLAWTMDLLLPVLLKAVQNIDEVIVSPDDRKMLRDLRDERLLFFTNHPTTAEPPITYHLGNLMGARFQYMASRQVFDWNGGIAGKVISNLGGFSVIAGINDRESFKTARAALAKPGGKLVLYPEGEPTSGENDSLMPFQQGAAQISFWAMDDARKIDPNANIMILPGFIKYVAQGTENEVRAQITAAIAKLEKKMQIDPGNKNLLRRFLTVGRVMVEEAEAEYKISAASEGDFDYRIGRIRHAILDNVAEKLGVTNATGYDLKADAIIKLRFLFAQLEMIMIDYPDAKLPKLSESEKEWVHRELVKAFDFIVIKKDYLISRPTAERFMEWLARFESYKYGKTPRALGGEPPLIARKAYVKFARPFPITEYWSENKSEKKKGVDKMLKRLRNDIQDQLDDALNLTQPLVKPYDVGDD